ncbi:HNH endonuclease [Paenibacillus sp. FSL L8-0340]|uniref:HNH endonuclease n=1 Tax=Paenibacillus sp. FSL L8-0340 TaxID=2954685 RepID=UPI00315991A1
MKQPKEKKASSLGRSKTDKKPISPWKQGILADHKSNPSRADRNEFPPAVIKLLKKRADGRCEVCKQRSDIETHHVRTRARDGRGVFQNGLRVCGICHDFIQTNEEEIQFWENKWEKKFGPNFWFDEIDIEIHARKQAAQQAIEQEQEQRRQQIEPVADLIATAAGRPLRVREMRLLESLEVKQLQVITGMFTDALNGYAAQGAYRPNDRFED